MKFPASGLCLQTLLRSLTRGHFCDGLRAAEFMLVTTARIWKYDADDRNPRELQSARNETGHLKVQPARIHNEVLIGEVESFDDLRDGSPNNLPVLRMTATMKAPLKVTDPLVEHQNGGDVRIGAMQAA